MVKLYINDGLKWNLYDTYESVEAMIEYLITTYGVDELKDCDKNYINYILYDWKFKYEIVAEFRVPKDRNNPTINPIIDNRIVKDKTFALRFLNFVLDTNCGDACSEDEKESMVSYATTLLKYQIETATEQTEIDYLVRCGADEKLKKGLKFIRK